MITAFLFIEDNSSDFEIIQHWALKNYQGCAFHRAWDRESMEKVLAEIKPDVYLCDYSLPTFPWPGAFDLARALDNPLKPFIVLSGMPKDDRGLLAINAGGRYVSKDEIHTRLKIVIDSEWKMYKARMKTREAANLIRR